MILVIDNYDSFVHNLARYVRELGGEPLVRRNDQITVDEASSMRPSHVVLSPGPGTPIEAGICTELVRSLGPRVPILGVCLGHQCIGVAYGGTIVPAQRPMHGKTSSIHHDGEGIFRGIPDPFEATRYHSLAIARDSLPDQLRVTATEPDGEIMAVQHREHPVFGVQFHPESVLTEGGHALLKNFLQQTTIPRPNSPVTHPDRDTLPFPSPPRA